MHQFSQPIKMLTRDAGTGLKLVEVALAYVLDIFIFLCIFFILSILFFRNHVSFIDSKSLVYATKHTVRSGNFLNFLGVE